MEKLKQFVEWVVMIYKKLRIGKSYWSVVTVLVLFWMREAAATSDILPNLFRAGSESTQNIFGKVLLVFLSFIVDFQLPGWVIIVSIVFFAVVSTLYWYEVRGSKITEKAIHSIARTEGLAEESNLMLQAGIKNWEEWKKSPNLSNEYITNDTLKEVITKIQIEASIEKNEIRILGLSGLGKTRLVFEAFKQKPDLQPKLLYCNVAQYGMQLKQYVSVNYNKEPKIIIADNCDTENYRELIEIITSSDSKTSIITIDFETRKSGISKPILLENKMLLDVTEKILNSHFRDQLSPSEIRRIAEFADGFPQMAVLFAKGTISKETDFSNFLDKTIIEKLVWGRDAQNEQHLKVIKGSAIFTNLGMTEGSESEGKFVAKEIVKIPWETFYSICKSFIDRGIMEPRGNRIVVKPPPLAVSLAGSWWREYPQSEIGKLLENVTKENLSRQMCDRLGMLGHLMEAKEVVAKLCGENGFFRNAEVLNSELGSRLFRSLVEANPEVTVNTLVYLYGNKTKKDLLLVQQGRRNLVWSLEKLCFNPDTFSRAAKLLLAFAVAENEHWSNNATHQFLQLFQLRLPGTAAKLSKRQEILRFGLSQEDREYKDICIRALGTGLKLNNFQRMMGAEKQGIVKPLEDNIPLMDEVFGYWDYIVDELTKLILQGSEFKVLAKAELAGGITALFQEEHSEKLVDALQEIIVSDGIHWPDALNNLKFVLERKKVNGELERKAVQLIGMLTPKDLPGRILQIVTKPEWESFEKDETGNFIDKQRIKAEMFAEELSKEKIKWEDYLPLILSKEQIQGANFGRKLSELINDPFDFALTIIKVLKNIPKADRNPEVLGGFLSGVKNKQIARKIMQLIIKDSEVSEHSFYLLRVSNPEYEDILDLFSIVDRFKYPISNFLALRYGRALDNLSVDQLIDMGRRLSEYGIEGKWTALILINQITSDDIKKFGECKEFLKGLISSDNLILCNLNFVDAYGWQSSVEKMFSLEYDQEFLQTVVTQILEFCASISFNHSIDVYIKNTLHKLLSSYFEDTWTFLTKGIIGPYPIFFHLKFLIGSQNGNWGQKGILFNNSSNDQIILQWCRENMNIAAERLMELVPLQLKQNGVIEWFPLTKALIDEHGDKGEVLRKLNSNMASYGITGSAIPYLVSVKNLLMTLHDHDILSVREWAAKNVEYYDKLILNEKITEEEEQL